MEIRVVRAGEVIWEQGKPPGPVAYAVAVRNTCSSSG
jgi:hypothetical protein